MQATRTALRLASRVTRSASLLSSTPVVRSRILPSSSLLSTFSSSSRHLSSSSSTTTTTSTPSSESLPIPEHSATCWSCAVPLDVASSTHCASCQTILPVPPPTLGGATYFQLLDLGEEPNFELDEGALKRVFLQKSRGVHPDGYKGKGEIEYQLAQQQSSLLNKAYEALKNPLSRAQYILSLYNIEVQETEAVSDQELLMEILEAREALEEAESEEEVESIRESNREKAEETIQSLAKAFLTKDLIRAKELCIELRYWRNVDDAVKNKVNPVD